MGNLFLTTTIVDRKIAKKYYDLYQENNKHVMFVSYGVGTASSEIMDYLGLEHTEKTVMFFVSSQEEWLDIKKQLER